MNAEIQGIYRDSPRAAWSLLLKLNRELQQRSCNEASAEKLRADLRIPYLMYHTMLITLIIVGLTDCGGEMTWLGLGLHIT